MLVTYLYLFIFSIKFDAIPSILISGWDGASLFAYDYVL